MQTKWIFVDAVNFNEVNSGLVPFSLENKKSLLLLWIDIYPLDSVEL